MFACERAPRPMEGGCRGDWGRNQVWTETMGGAGGQGPPWPGHGHVGQLGSERSWAADQWVSGQGPNKDDADKGQKGAAEWVARRGAEARLSVRQTQGLHYGSVGAGTAARSAP